jgi:hypothetical protein
MSMRGNFRQISPSLLERIKAQPGLVDSVVRYRHPEKLAESDAEAFISLLPAHMRKAIEAMPAEMRDDFFAQFESSVADMPDVLKDQIAAARRPMATKRTPAAAIDPAEVGAELDIDKAWHGLHFLLCGSAGEALGPLGSAVLGGKEIGADSGHGPARYLEPPEVNAIAHALGSLTSEVLAERFDPAALDQHKVYPGRWVANDEHKEWLCDAFSQLQSFYRSAAEAGHAVLLYIV